MRSKLVKGLLVAAILALPFLLTVSAEEKYLASVFADKLELLDEKQWSGVEDIDGKKVRRITKGQTALFTIPAWWNGSVRPAAGSVYIVEMDFRDDGSLPIIVSSFGNCKDSSVSLSELHRVAGEGSKNWKTAFIPVSWDYLYSGVSKHAGEGKQVFSIQVSKDEKADLPVSGFRVRAASPEDEKRYNAETRAWIKKIQSRIKTDDIDSPEQDKPELTGELRSKACVPYVRNYLDPVVPSSTPKMNELDVQVKIRLAQNEIECAQLGVYANGRELSEVTLEAAKFKNDKGNVLAAEVRLFTMEYALVKSGNGMFKHDAQRMWPLYAAEIASGKSQGYFVTIKTNEKQTEPGKYTGKINVLVKGNISGSLPVEVEILPVKLLSMDEAGLSMGGCVTGFVPFHNISYAVDNNVNAINLWASSVKPGMKKVDGKLVLDFTLIDEWMKEARRLGCKNITYFMGGNPYGFPRTLTVEREIFVVMQDEGERKDRVSKYISRASAEGARDKVLPELRELYGQWVKEVTEHARANNWPEIILTPFDEPAKYTQGPYRKDGSEKDENVIGAGPWIKSYFEDACDLIRKYAAPGTRIYGSIHHATGLVFLPKINVFCTNAIHEDSKLGNKIRAAGPEKYFWQYTGVGANSEPAKMRYTFGFFFGAFNSRGSLLWAYNWGNRFDTTEGDNWMICWDTPFSVIPNLSYEGLREAWDDRRYIETLRKAAKDKEKIDEVEAFLEKIFGQAVQSRTAGGRDTVDDFWSQTKDPEKLNEWRSQIADKIVKLNQ